MIAANSQRLTLSKISTADVKHVNSNSSSCSLSKPVNWFPNVSLQVGCPLFKSK